MSTSGGYHDECGGYHEYIGGCSVHRRDTMSTSGNIMSTLGDVQYIGGISSCQMPPATLICSAIL